jgi:hypothetical protein
MPARTLGMELKVVGNQLILSGRVVGDEPAKVQEAFANSPEIDTVVPRNSPGGDAPAGYQVVLRVRVSHMIQPIRGDRPESRIEPIGGEPSV